MVAVPGLVWLLAAMVSVCPVLAVAQSGNSDADLEIDGARYQYRRWECDIKKDRFTVTYGERVTIVNDRGADHAQLVVYEGSFAKVKEIEARLIGANGSTIVKKDKGDFRRHCGWSDYGLYADVCNYTTDLSLPSYPYSIEWEYTVEYKNLLRLPTFRMQSDAWVDTARVVITSRKSVPWRYKAYGRTMTPIVDESGKEVTLVFTTLDLPSVSNEDDVPAGEYALVRLALAPDKFKLDRYEYSGNTWQDIGRWYSELADQSYLKGTRTVSDVAPDDPFRALQAAYRSLVDHIRYVAIEVGVGGWQPTVAAKVRHVGYGDCKDMSTLLISELHRAGIRAFPVLVRTRDLQPLDRGFPEFDFNHAIAVALIGSDTVWLDPTCDVCRPGELPLSDEGLDVLVSTDSGGELWHTPLASADRNLTVRRTHIRVDSDGLLHVSARLEFFGHQAQSLRRFLPTLDRRHAERFVSSLLRGGSKAFNVASYELSGLTIDDSAVAVVLEADSKRSVDRLRGALYCPPFLFGALYGVERTDFSKRTLALDLGYPDRILDTVRIGPPQTDVPWTFDPPPDDSTVSETGRVVFTTSIADGEMVVTLDRSILTDVVQPDQFSLFEKFRDHLKSLYRAHVKLTPAVN